MTKGEVRAAEYRARAFDALELAESAVLDHVREQRRKSADMWTRLAEAEDVRNRGLRNIVPPAVAADKP